MTTSSNNNHQTIKENYPDLHYHIEQLKGHRQRELTRHQQAVAVFEATDKLRSDQIDKLEKTARLMLERSKRPAPSPPPG